MKNNLDMVLSSITKQFGKNTIMKLTEEPEVDADNVISSSSIALDTALGIGGYPKGRIIEIYGPESSGKTTLTLHAVANAQKQGTTCTFIDMEHALDPRYAAALGVDLNTLLVAQPNFAEQALAITDMLARSGDVGLIVIDSVAALIPQAELEGEMGDKHIGLQARLMSQAMRKLTGVANQTKCTIIFINQIRMKIGVMFGSPETTTGGNALKFYSSQRLDIRRIGKINSKDGSVIGNKTRVKVVKNKLAPPFREAEFDIRFGVGIDSIAEVIDLGIEDGIVKKSGAWFSLDDGTKVGQGRDNAVQFMKDNPDITEKIRKELLENRGLR
jgi:recombination protein RecA